MNKLFILIILVIVLSLRIKAQDVIYNGCAFNLLSDSEAELVALPDGKKYEGDIVVPASACGGRYTVVKIGDRAFKDCTRLTSVDMYGMVHADIGVEAMAGCTNLRKVIMPYMLLYPMKIGNRAFMNSGCEYLEIPPNVTEIGDSAFFGMTIKEIALGSSDLKTIGSAVLANSRVEYVYCGMRCIPDNTFKDCTNLKYIVLPKSISVIGANAFRGCKNLKSLSIPKKLCHIGKNAFDGVKLDCIVFNDVETTPQYTFSSICGNHIPNLIMFPVTAEKAYHKWCPKMFKKRIPLLVSGGGGFHLSNKLISQETSRVAPSSIILRNSSKNFDNDAEILINKGGNLSIIVEHYTAYGISNSKSTGTGGKGYAAMVNDKLVRLQHMYLETIIEQEDYTLISPHNLYILELKGIKSPTTVNIEWK
ncbi:MAG: leucine-rich repeat domain-containing protein [Bacteroides sp.]|nr:leucine-rich repeat domain-containing protein [Bacteroides sp.]